MAEARLEVRLGTRGCRRQVLERARHADQPRVIAQVALELAGDRRNGEGGERRASVGFESIDRLHEADEGDLLEVLERFAPPLEATRKATRQRHPALHERVARLFVAALLVAAEKSLLFGHRRRVRCPSDRSAAGRLDVEILISAKCGAHP